VMVNNSTNINKANITLNKWWSTIPPISTKRTITLNKWWSTIPPILTKRTSP
jgi:hypothetical protein